MKKITIITGHYGSGKTNISVNLALSLAGQGHKVSIVDLDIVNPYFRTADFENIFSECGVELIKSMYANSNLDIPAISFDIEHIIRENRYLIVDVGGDDSGAVALGMYQNIFSQFSDYLDMFYVINKYRYISDSVDETVELMYQIENSARIKHTGIINNSNLGFETTAETVRNSMDFAEKISQKTNLPLVYTACKNSLDISEYTENILPVEIFVKPLWEE